MTNDFTRQRAIDLLEDTQAFMRRHHERIKHGSLRLPDVFEVAWNAARRQNGSEGYEAALALGALDLAAYALETGTTWREWVQEATREEVHRGFAYALAQLRNGRSHARTAPRS